MTEILELPDERLRLISEPVESIDDYIRQLAEDMISVIEENGALGLAAVQIGHTVRVIAGKFFSKKIDVLVNPKILWRSPKKVTYPEACLSVPDKSCFVTRPSEVKITGTTIKGKIIFKHLKKYEASLFQHEMDHLNGKLIVDYVGYNENL